ncbi:PepSY domain-containing protein [Kocuria sp. M1N1S27]|uniref:PepSY domain-containing protein n=1 Tax=Kocuria kalidii TaxID=3376283 RepID=UPI003788F7B9
MEPADRAYPTLAALAASALLLVGCGGNTDVTEEVPLDEDTVVVDPTPEPDGSPSAASPSPSAEATGTASPSSTAPPSGDETNALVSAVGTAEDAAGEDGRAFEVDLQDSPASWEIAVAAGELQYDVYVSRDGTEVFSQEEDDLDSDDRLALDRARVPLEDALRTALSATNGTLEDAELETEDGVLVWEIGVDEPGGNSADVFVNAENGSVLKIDR